LAVATNDEAHRKERQHRNGYEKHNEDGEEHAPRLSRVTPLRNSRAMATAVLTKEVPQSIIASLRGEPSLRPLADTVSASGLRAQLEDGLFEILGTAVPAEPLTVYATSLGQVATTNINQSPLGQIRGVLVSQLLRLLSVGAHIATPFEDALCAWKAEVRTSELFDHLARLDSDERARLRTDVTAHFVTLQRALGTVPPRWLPRTSVRTAQRLGGGTVVLRDVVDLMVGSSTTLHASVALFDVTTAPLGVNSERTMRYHALLQTLRSNVVPLRTCTFSTATGETWIHDVDYTMLARSVDDVLGALYNMWKNS